MARRQAPRPWRQSDLDKTCGIVSSVNAIRLCVGAGVLGRYESAALFAAGADYLLRRKALRGILKEGMSDGQHLHLVHFLCRLMCRRYGQRIKVCRPFRGRVRAIPIQRFVYQVRHFLRLRGTAVIISFETLEYAHFTVVRGVTRSSLLLSDSGFRDRLPLKSCSTAFSAHKRGFRYCIPVSTTIFLRLVS